MKTHVGTRVLKALSSVAIVMALMGSMLIPAAAQSRRRPALRRRAPVRKVIKPVVPEVVYYNINSGQVINVRMNETITSEIARVGQQFTTTVMIPVYASGIEIIPAGSQVIGRVTSVTRAQRQSKAGTIGVHFVSLRLPTGTTRAINGDLVEMIVEDGNYDNEGGVEGRSAVKRNAVFIGGGAATGALIGAIAGGGKGAGIGAGVGAGLGVAGAFFSKGHEAVVKSGTEFGVILNQTLSLPAANVR